MPQEAVYLYQPKLKRESMPGINDYLRLKYPEDVAHKRQVAFEKLQQELLEMDAELTLYQLESSRSELWDWLTTPSGRVHTSILMEFDPRLFEFPDDNWHTASIYAAECPNLKCALRNIVGRITERGNSATGVDKRLLYDFGVLESWAASKSDDLKILIVIDDADAFPKTVISELIDYIYSFSNLPIRLLLKLSAPTEAFEEQIPRKTIEKMDARVFESRSSQDYVDQAVRICQTNGVELSVWFKELLESEHQHRIFRVLNYFIMVYFTSNPLVFLNTENIVEFLPIIRRLPSFRRLVEETKSFNLCTDDNALVVECKKALVKFSESSLLCERCLDPKELYYHVFDPNYRHAIETALAEPSYYYPYSSPINLRQAIPISLLYSQFRGADLYVNIYDQYMMFKDQINRPEHYKDEDWDKIAVTWFQQAVTELTKVQVVRTTKRKTNSLEKVSFKGV